MTSILKPAVLSAAVALLAGCGGNGNANPGGQPTFNYTPIADTTATTPSQLSGGAVDTVSGAVTTDTGTLNHVTKLWTLGQDSATVDLAAGTGTITSGGALTVFGQQTFVAGFVAQPTGSNTSLMFAGVPTAAGDMANAPATATYTGASKVLISDGTASYALDGAATASMDFAAGSGSALISGLDGTRSDLGGGVTAVTDVATIGLNNLLISGAGFSGDQLTVTSNQLQGTMTGNATIDVQGGFYGTAAQDIGGVLSAVDTTNGTLSVQGAFTGAR